MIAFEIEAVEWRASVVGIVAVRPVLGVYDDKNEHIDGGWTCYIGVGKGEDPIADAINIRSYGTRLSRLEAHGFFPLLDPDKYGHE